MKTPPRTFWVGVFFSFSYGTAQHSAFITANTSTLAFIKIGIVIAN